MDNKTLLLMSGGALVIGTALYFTNRRIDMLSGNISNLLSGIDKISDNIDIPVSDTIVQAAVDNAAKKAANDAIASLKKSLAKDIDYHVTEAINKAYATVEGDVKTKLLNQVNIQTIENIENKVSEKLVKRILSTSSLKMFTPNDSKESIIKTCAENGMSAWEIERILNASTK